VIKISVVTLMTSRSKYTRDYFDKMPINVVLF